MLDINTMFRPVLQLGRVVNSLSSDILVLFKLTVNVSLVKIKLAPDGV